ncbi:MAG: nitroreductase [Pseudomonadota bacterium]
MSFSSGRHPAAAVTDAINSRRSVRAFTSTPVSPDVIKRILQTASRAPSGTNMQPWHVYVLQGAQLDRTIAAVQADFDNDVPFDAEEKYYPDRFFEPYTSRRRAVGLGLYKLLGLTKDNTAGMRAQHRRNYQFFDAPVGLICTIDRALNTGSWLDYGMFIQNVLLLAREAGLHTCPQAAFCGYHLALRRTLPIPQDQVVVCGISLGFADLADPANALVTERAEPDDWVTFVQ